MTDEYLQNCETSGTRKTLGPDEERDGETGKAPKNIEIYTDGACSGNPGPGGWGVLFQYQMGGSDVLEKTLCGGAAQTTNNQMELTAAIIALESLKTVCNVRLYTDSQYVRNGILQWIPAWKHNLWRKSDNKPVKNVHLWKRLDLARSGHQVDWRWVRGHMGNAGNERADMLARKGMQQFTGRKTF